MKLLRPISFLLLALGAGLFAVPVSGQQSNPPLATGHVNLPPLPLPPLPSMKPPITQFRELLAMNRLEREKYLATRTPEARKGIEGKLTQYDALSPEQCELRLRVTELRYYLFPLLTTSVTNRAVQLNMIPEELKPMIELRLKKWDQLSSDKQRELLENEKAIRYLADSASNATPVQNPDEALRESIQKWNQLVPGDRAAIANRFEQFFGLSLSEKQDTFSRLPPLERVQIEKAVQTLAKLEPAKRAQAFRALNKLTGLPPAEQQAFMRSAERWKTLSQEERKAWRNLVVNLSHLPPYPPGMNRTAYPPPPPPPQPTIPHVTGEKVATNE